MSFLLKPNLPCWLRFYSYFYLSVVFGALVAQVPASPLWECSFSEEESLQTWKVKFGSLQWALGKESPHSENVLIWKTAAGGQLGKAFASQNWQTGALFSFWVRQAEPHQTTLEIHLKTSAQKVFWRKIELEPNTYWQEIQVPLYRFARKNGPYWKNIQALVFYAHHEGEFQLAKLQLLPASAGHCGLIEPSEMLVARTTFGTPDAAKTFHSKHFRLITDAPLEGEKILQHFEELLTSFQKTFSLSEAPELPLTFVIFQEKENYLQFCSKTVQDVYGLKLSPTLSDGRTFFDYCASSYSEHLKENRPVYIHEMTHQLISKYLGFDVDQYWIQEGIASLFQRDFFKEPTSLNTAIQKMVSQKAWKPLQKLDARYLPPTSEYLQMLTLVEFLLKGEFSAKWPMLRTCFQEGQSLKTAVEKVLALDLLQFEQKWLSFCLAYYKK